MGAVGRCEIGLGDRRTVLNSGRECNRESADRTDSDSIPRDSYCAINCLDSSLGLRDVRCQQGFVCRSSHQSHTAPIATNLQTSKRREWTALSQSSGHARRTDVAKTIDLNRAWPFECGVSEGSPQRTTVPVQARLAIGPGVRANKLAQDLGAEAFTAGRDARQHGHRQSEVSPYLCGRVPLICPAR